MTRHRNGHDGLGAGHSGSGHSGSSHLQTKVQLQARILDQMQRIRVKLSPKVLGAVRDLTLEAKAHEAEHHPGHALLADFFRKHDPKGVYRAATTETVRRLDAEVGRDTENVLPSPQEVLADPSGTLLRSRGGKDGETPRVMQLLAEKSGPNHGTTHSSSGNKRKRSAGDQLLRSEHSATPTSQTTHQGEILNHSRSKTQKDEAASRKAATVSQSCAQPHRLSIKSLSDKIRKALS